MAVTWVEMADSEFDPEAPLTSAKMQGLNNHAKAMAQAATGAPQIVNAALAGWPWTVSDLSANSVGASQIINESVGQSEIGSGAVHWDEVDKTTQQSSTSLGVGARWSTSFTGGIRTLGWTLSASNAGDATLENYPSSGYATGIGILNSSGTTRTFYFQAAFINSSPPYDLGDGVFPGFIFGVINNTTRALEAVDISGAAPWHYNGPTNIAAKYYNSQGRGFRRVKRQEYERLVNNVDLRAMALDPATRTAAFDILNDDAEQEIEITQSIKNRDINLIPHPFLGNDLTGKTIVMLDCRCHLGRIMKRLLQDGENIAELFMSDYVRFQNTTLDRITPPGVIAVNARWRDTGRI